MFYKSFIAFKNKIAVRPYFFNISHFMWHLYIYKLYDIYMINFSFESLAPCLLMLSCFHFMTSSFLICVEMEFSRVS